MGGVNLTTYFSQCTVTTSGSLVMPKWTGQDFEPGTFAEQPIQQVGLVASNFAEVLVGSGQKQKLDNGLVVAENGYADNLGHYKVTYDPNTPVNSSATLESFGRFGRYVRVKYSEQERSGSVSMGVSRHDYQIAAGQTIQSFEPPQTGSMPTVARLSKYAAEQYLGAQHQLSLAEVALLLSTKIFSDNSASIKNMQVLASDGNWYDLPLRVTTFSRVRLPSSAKIDVGNFKIRSLDKVPSSDQPYVEMHFQKNTVDIRDQAVVTFNYDTAPATVIPFGASERSFFEYFGAWGAPADPFSELPDPFLKMPFPEVLPRKLSLSRRGDFSLVSNNASLLHRLIEIISQNEAFTSDQEFIELMKMLGFEQGGNILSSKEDALRFSILLSKHWGELPNTCRVTAKTFNDYVLARIANSAPEINIFATDGFLKFIELSHQLDVDDTGRAIPGPKFDRAFFVFKSHLLKIVDAYKISVAPFYNDQFVSLRDRMSELRSKVKRQEVVENREVDDLLLDSYALMNSAAEVIDEFNMRLDGLFRSLPSIDVPANDRQSHGWFMLRSFDPVFAQAEISMWKLQEEAMRIFQSLQTITRGEQGLVDDPEFETASSAPPEEVDIGEVNDDVSIVDHVVEVSKRSNIKEPIKVDFSAGDKTKLSNAKVSAFLSGDQLEIEIDFDQALPGYDDALQTVLAAEFAEDDDDMSFDYDRTKHLQPRVRIIGEREYIQEVEIELNDMGLGGAPENYLSIGYTINTTVEPNKPIFIEITNTAGERKIVAIKL